MSSPVAHELSISPAASGAWAGAALLGTSPANNSGGGGSSGQRKASKGKARDREAYGSSPIALLPLELLAHVFAHLPPPALGTCQLVCKVWNEVVGDEGSWRTAFETYYDVSPDSLGRRLEPGSWRLEYITRVSLLRQWHRSRTPTILHNPSLGAIDSIHVHLPSAAAPASTSRSSRSDFPSLTATPLLSVSLSLGAAVHSAPFTGKLSKRPLLSSPIDHLGRPLGLPIIPAKSFAVSPDGARLIWGMRDGSLRLSNSSTPGGGLGIPGGGRGTVGGALEQGEVRALLDAHREGSSVLQVAFSNAGGTGGGKVLKGLKQRFDVFATAGADGVVALWSLSVPPAAAVGRERAPPAVKLWQARWDVALDLSPASSARARPGASEAPARSRVKPTALALDAGWLGRHHGRPASLAVGRSDGKTIVWRRVELDEEKLASDGGMAAQASEPVVLEAPTKEEGEEVDTLIFDPAETATAPLSLLVHQAGAANFERYVFPPLATTGGETAPPSRTTFGHPLGKEYLSALTAFAVDFDPPPAVVAPSQPQTPAEGKPPNASSAGRIVSLHPSSTLPSMPSLSRTVSELSLQPAPSPSLSISLSTFDSAAADLPSSSRFGRRKYVAAGDSSGRVFLWDWEARQAEDEAERGDVVGPSKAVQGLEIEGGGEASASKVTALEVTEVGVFVGGLDGTLRFYSSLGPAQLLSPPLRTFRDRSAPRHPARHLAAGLIAPDEEERWLVSHVRASRDAVVAAIGGRVLAWRLSGGEVKKKVGVKGKGGFSARQERFKANLELQHQVRESISAISAESAARLEAHEDARRRSYEFGLPPSLGNMTEEEAVAFATMLSLDEQEASLFADDSQDWEQLPEEWTGEEVDGFVLDEDYERRRASTSGTRWTTEDEGEEEDDLAFSSRMTSRRGSREQSLSTSLSVPTSPYLRNGSVPMTSSPSTSRFAASSSPGRSGVQHTWTPVSPTLLAVGSPPSSFNPNGKVQVSPRLGPTYGSHGALYVNEAVPDMSPELWPTAAASSPASPPSRRLSLAGPSPLGPAASMSPPFTALPAPVASTSSTAAPSATTSTPIRRGWSEVARSTPASSSASPVALRGSPSPHAHTSTSPPTWPSPSLGASYTPPPKPTASSLLAEQLRASELSAREEEARRRAEREQEELDLAIALSLSASQAGAEGGEGDEVGELRI
ncbi:hypothetical protein JCM8097_004557 [Rhodosporidiobolus ruineniae]